MLKETSKMLQKHYLRGKTRKEGTSEPLKHYSHDLHQALIYEYILHAIYASFMSPLCYLHFACSPMPSVISTGCLQIIDRPFIQPPPMGRVDPENWNYSVKKKLGSALSGPLPNLHTMDIHGHMQ